MKLWKSNVLNVDMKFTICPFDFVVLINRLKSFYMYVLSDYKPGPYKIQFKNKWVLVYYTESEPYDISKRYSELLRYMIPTKTFEFCKEVSKTSGIICEWSAGGFYYYDNEDESKVKKFYEALEIKTT